MSVHFSAQDQNVGQSDDELVPDTTPFYANQEEDPENRKWFWSFWFNS